MADKPKVAIIYYSATGTLDDADPPAGHPATHDQHASLRDRARQQAHDQELERVQPR
jgi:hypothetical protein